MIGRELTILIGSFNVPDTLSDRRLHNTLCFDWNLNFSYGFQTPVNLVA